MKTGLTYKDAGVDIHEGDAIAEDIGKLARNALTPEVIGGVGGFAGLFEMSGELSLLRGGTYKNPVLVACTDGVGTKLKIAFMTGRHDTIGIDCVAMSVNDLIVQGAQPLFFLDYIGIEHKDPKVCHDIVAGVVAGCRQAGCALLGGETASLPGMYFKGEYDLAGFCVGLVERGKIVDGKKVTAGDVIIGVHSSGLHSNGYSLARKALLEVGGYKLEQHIPELGKTLADELLTPTMIYADAVAAVLKHYTVKENVHAMANITGSGLPGNIPRTIPNGKVVKLKRGTWPIPPIFRLIQDSGGVADAEMFDTFNMGIGMTIACPKYYAHSIQEILREKGCGSSLIGVVEDAADAGAEAVVVIEG